MKRNNLLGSSIVTSYGSWWHGFAGLRRRHPFLCENLRRRSPSSGWLSLWLFRLTGAGSKKSWTNSIVGWSVQHFFLQRTCRVQNLLFPSYLWMSRQSHIAAYQHLFLVSSVLILHGFDQYRSIPHANFWTSECTLRSRVLCKPHCRSSPLRYALPPARYECASHVWPRVLRAVWHGVLERRWAHAYLASLAAQCEEVPRGSAGGGGGGARPRRSRLRRTGTRPAGPGEESHLGAHEEIRRFQFSIATP
jgi:hypothetical protein